MIKQEPQISRHEELALSAFEFKIGYQPSPYPMPTTLTVINKNDLDLGKLNCPRMIFILSFCV